MGEKASGVVSRYYEGWNKNDIDQMASTLGSNFKFRGPMEQHDSAESFVTAVRKMVDQWGELKINPKTKLEQDNQVVAIYDCDMPNGQSLPMAEHFVIDKGKISEINLFFDASKMAN